MNISHVSVSTLPVLHRFGGAIQRRIVEIAREPARRGHRVGVYSVGDATETRGAHGVTYRFLHCRTRLPWRHLEFQHRVARELPVRADDVLHFHSQPEGAWMSQAVGARKVLSYHFFQFRGGRQTPLYLCTSGHSAATTCSCRARGTAWRSRRASGAFPRASCGSSTTGSTPTVPARSGGGRARAHPARHRQEGDALRGPGLRAERERLRGRGADAPRAPPRRAARDRGTDRAVWPPTIRGWVGRIAEAGGLYLGPSRRAGSMRSTFSPTSLCRPGQRDVRHGRGRGGSVRKPVVSSHSGGLKEVVAVTCGARFPVGDASGMGRDREAAGRPFARCGVRGGCAAQRRDLRLGADP